MNAIDFTVYKIDHSAVDEKTENDWKRLKGMVGASGFDGPASCSRNRFQRESG